MLCVSQARGEKGDNLSSRRLERSLKGSQVSPRDRSTLANILRKFLFPGGIIGSHVSRFATERILNLQSSSRLFHPGKPAPLFP